jgi:hypothetical protein
MVASCLHSDSPGLAGRAPSHENSIFNLGVTRPIQMTTT